MLWVRNFLSELEVLKARHLNLWCHNKSTICIANNLVQHDRTKHIEIDNLFIKNKLDARIIKVNYVSTWQQVDDYPTKGLAVKNCNRACVKVRTMDIYHSS